MRSNLPRPVLVAVVLCLAAACAAGTQPASPAGDADRTAVAASLDDREARDLATRVNAFGFDLLAELLAGSDELNVVTSPVSVASLLAMILAGAGGETAEAMAAVLHLDEPEIGSEHAALLFALTETDDVAVEVASSLWIDAPMEPGYLERARTVFDATAAEVDLGEQATADDIDAWVTTHTQGMIDTIAEDLGLPDPTAVLVLLNAVYFQGTWTVAFDPDDTVDGPFTTASGDAVTVPLMNLGWGTDERFGYADVGGTQVLRLPYGDTGRFAMDLVLPPEGDDLTGTVRGLDAEAWAALTAGLSEQQVQVTVPRLDLTDDADLEAALTSLGMGRAFSAAADFSPMSPADPVLDTVVHKTVITVDESGTTAAAVTGGVMAVSGPPAFRADRPFLFAITDTRTGGLLFLGAVRDPTA